MRSPGSTASGGCLPSSCSPCFSCRLWLRRTRCARRISLSTRRRQDNSASCGARPVLAGMRLPIILKLPGRVKNLKDPVVSELADSLVERRWIDAGPSGLAGERIEFAGLQLTITDVLVRVQTRDGAVSTTLVRPNRPWIQIATTPGLLAVAGAYVLHGIEHILFGFDHLLFVLALILIVRGRRMLLWTITAFTVAHSITLSLATLGLVHLPGPPVEAMIALSILLLACEIVRLQRGQASMTAQRPWVVAFSFGSPSRLWIRQRPDANRVAAKRHPSRAVHVQRRRRSGAAHLYRRNSRSVCRRQTTSSLRQSLNAARFSLRHMRSEPWLRSCSSNGWPGSQPDREAGLTLPGVVPFDEHGGADPENRVASSSCTTDCPNVRFGSSLRRARFV